MRDLTKLNKSKKKAIILRGSRCFGDMIMVSWVPKVLKQKRNYQEVKVASWKANSFIFDNNPFVDEVIILDDIKLDEYEQVKTKWEIEHDYYDFRFTCEFKFLKNSSDNIIPVDDLRRNSRGKNYYKDGLSAFGLEGEKGDLYLSSEEKEKVKRIKSDKSKKVLWQLRGAGRNKFLMYGIYYINEIIKRMPNAEHWLFDDVNDAFSGLRQGKIRDMRGKLKPREALALVPAFDLVIGPESFLTNVAGAFDIPVMIFYSHSAPENLGRYFKYHYPIVPNCDCHPCYHIIKDWRQFYNLKERRKALDFENKCLLRDPKDVFKTLGFRCCVELNHELIINQIINILQE